MRRTDYPATSRAAVNFRPQSNICSPRPPYTYRRSNFPANSRQFRPPDHPSSSSRPDNFIIELRLVPNSDCSNTKTMVEGLITDCCKSSPDNYVIFNSGEVAGRLSFTEWNCALEAVVGFWESLLNGTHNNFIPSLIPNVIVPSDVNEMNDRLKPLFLKKLRSLISDEIVKKWENKLQEVKKEINTVSARLRKPRRMKIFEELNKKKKGLISESELIMKRIEEFKCAVNCILSHLEECEEEHEAKVWVPAFRFKDRFNWPMIYSMIIRECRRLDDGLPIYAFRREILWHISSQQIMVLIGETGSGKSTQLLQFLADSGIVADGSVICTQPRKIAAISLANRVQEESNGCCENNAVTCHPSYSSAQQFMGGKLIYMTDHCLLQHCMKDKNLSGVSCILVDEAHERSLNTDLLLALLKKLLPSRPNLRIIIMSATANAEQLSEYFFGCRMFKIAGRNFPVDVKYVECLSESTSQSITISSGNVAPYVSEIVRRVTEIHKTEEEGTILAFLTSPMEVEWACDRFLAPNAIPLSLHGKLSYGEQSRVFQDYPGKRKVIFSTNVAETSLTIPGVKFVVDSGLAKESMFDHSTGMNVLRVCHISKSSANQRAGRAGRTEPGRCYRLYSQDDFHSMADQQEPEIRRVHLGVAVLKIIALGVKKIREFDFIDAPSPEAIDMAIRNLLQLGAVTLKNGDIELTDDGWYLVKLGIEPRLGKLILGCFSEGVGREGIVLAVVMANSSSIFCRVGNLADKLKSDCLRVPFCHSEGDLFTLLSVYRAWEEIPWQKRNKWCWENSINAKSMRRCHDTILEIERCLKNELHFIIPSYWSWRPEEVGKEHDKKLKKAVLASLAENVAMYSGYDKLGYKVALTGQHVQLHPSCSLLMFNHKPNWVVFSEILSASDQYLVCVTAFDQEFLSTLNPLPLFDASEMESQKLRVTTLSGFGKTLLKKFCGKSNNGLLCLISQIRKICGDERIGIEVDVDNNEIRLFSPSHDIEKVLNHVKKALDFERRWLESECMERCLYNGGPGIYPPVALFGSGAEIKHLELDKRSLTIDVFHSNVTAIDGKELISFIESYASGICAVRKSATHGQEIEEREKWGSITFLTPDAAKKAAELNNVKFNDTVLRVNLSGANFGVDRAFSFPAIKAKLSWPRRPSKGFGVVRCSIHDVGLMISNFSNLRSGERYIRCEPGTKSPDSVVISGIDKESSEPEILHALRSATDRRILDFFLVRGDAVDNPPCHTCEEVLFREISVFMPKGGPQINFCRVQVHPPEPKDVFMRALIIFDGRLHLEAAKALEHIEGKVLPGFKSWQKVQFQRFFHTSISCPASVYFVIKNELDSLVARFNRQKGIECTLDRNANGSFRVKISATATKTIADLRRPLEELMKGKIITHARLNPSILQHLFSRDGFTLMKSLHREMGIYVLFDKQSLNVRIFGPSDRMIVAEERFVQRLVNLHENKQLEIHLRRVGLPCDLMKEVVNRFGPDLHGLKEKLPEAEFTLNTRRHIISICGSKEAKLKAEEIVNEIARASGHSSEVVDAEIACPICLCEVEDDYQLESCMHVFCRSCLVEQCESAIKNNDSFPIRCAREGCGVPIWLVDLRSLLSSEKLEELFMASMGAFVSSSGGTYRFCPSPDCPSIYKVAGHNNSGEPFVCGACYVETCTKCHLEYHPFLSCEKYKEYKDDPDSSLKQWCSGKEEFVKRCPMCGYTIEKAEGCNHVECKCGRHLCWVCLEYFFSSDECYAHLRAIHQGIT